ncbi:MAG: prolipoprotein diacylglyceryl transferase [Hydrogenoanaerobacterium sp.]
MGELLTFPGLGLEFHLNRIAFQVGSYSIAWYGVIMAIAFLVGISYVMLRTKQFGLDGDRVIDVLLVSVIGAVIGARIYYVAFSWADYKDNLIDVFKIWEGGIAIYGGLIGGVIVGLIMCHFRRVRVLPMLDLAVGGLIIGQAIGRWGNFINIEAFGANTAMPWGMAGPVIENYLTRNAEKLAGFGVIVDPSMPVHPTFFYESVWCFLGFIAIALFTKRRRFDGELVLLYAVWYGCGRAIIEGLRTDSLMLGKFRVSQMLSIIAVLVAVTLWIIIRNKIKKANDPEYLKLYVKTDEAAQILSGSFYEKKEQDDDEIIVGKAEEAAPIKSEAAETDIISEPQKADDKTDE